jgi:hypothetical protein
MEREAGAALEVPGAVRAEASMKVSRKKKQLVKTSTSGRRNKIMRFADGEQNKHRPGHHSNAKF